MERLEWLALPVVIVDDGTAVAAATTIPTPAAEPRSILQFKLQKTREALDGNVQQFTVDMKEEKSLATLQKVIAVFKPVMADFLQKHSVYKFQVAVSILFHKAVDPAVGNTSTSCANIGNGCCVLRRCS